MRFTPCVSRSRGEDSALPTLLSSTQFPQPPLDSLQESVSSAQFYLSMRVLRVQIFYVVLNSPSLSRRNCIGHTDMIPHDAWILGVV